MEQEKGEDKEMRRWQKEEEEEEDRGGTTRRRRRRQGSSIKVFAGLSLFEPLGSIVEPCWRPLGASCLAFEALLGPVRVPSKLSRGFLGELWGALEAPFGAILEDIEHKKGEDLN